MIQSGHTVTVSGNLSYTGAPMRVDVHGTWRFSGGGAKISLPENSVIYIHEGGSVISNAPGASGVSQLISIGGSVYWQGGHNSTVTGPAGWPYGPLPVELLAFTVTAAPDVVTARWTTATEWNASHFEVQRSHDLLDWSVAGTLNASGHSMQVQHYELVERSVPEGPWYYRLVQVDLDGTRNPYLVVPVTIAPVAARMDCTPDPFAHDLIHIRLNREGSMMEAPVLIDASTGRIAMTTIEDASTVGMMVRIPDLAPGVYLLRAPSLGREGSCRFVIGG